MAKVFLRQYHLDTPCEVCDESGWTPATRFDNIADLYVEVQDVWNCDDFSMELETWCENASVGDVYEDDDIRVTVCELD